jgi:DNA (cytosine-5)-methyltransferase 1
MKYYLSEKIKPTILSNGSAGFKSKSEIDQVIARPLTATMHKMHRACQDNYFSDMYILSNGTDRPSERMTKAELAGLPIRRLTPKEAFLLQGFPNDFADRASTAAVADGALYKQAGNAVSVNTIYAVLYYLITNRIMSQ